MKTLKEFLEKHYACKDRYLFAKDLTLKEFLDTCPRGDWILWLFVRSNPRNKKLRVLVAAHCVNTVRHLMKDQRSTKAVDVAIKYGNGKATKQQLSAAAAAAADDDDADADTAAAYAAAYAYAATAAYATAAYATAYATDAAYAAYAAADAADAAAAAAYAAAYAARKKNQKLTADICRKYLPIEIWNIK